MYALIYLNIYKLMEIKFKCLFKQSRYGSHCDSPLWHPSKSDDQEIQSCNITRLQERSIHQQNNATLSQMLGI